ncbi:EAL domain-containing protein [Achromobacter insolitus]|uniref:EAL domain-containing protein n=1 Tax=Achromobacter insolitus TaxID=217204 RepID=UPI002FDD8994
MRCQENSAQLIQFHEHEVVEMLRDPSQLQLVFQPQVNLKTGRIESAEALARWNHPVWGVLPAGRFIGGILGLGLQGPLFRRVAELALAASAALTLAGKPLPLAINACAATLGRPMSLEALLTLPRDRRGQRGHLPGESNGLGAAASSV